MNSFLKRLPTNKQYVFSIFKWTMFLVFEFCFFHIALACAVIPICILFKMTLLLDGQCTPYIIIAIILVWTIDIKDFNTKRRPSIPSTIFLGIFLPIAEELLRWSSLPLYKLGLTNDLAMKLIVSFDSISDVIEYTVKNITIFIVELSVLRHAGYFINKIAIARIETIATRITNHIFTRSDQQ